MPLLLSFSTLYPYVVCIHCKNIKFVLNHGKVISFAYPLDVYCDFLIVCITDYYTITIGQQKDVCTITALFLFLRILTTNYSDTHHGEITVNTREDATEITIPWFNMSLIFLQCIAETYSMGICMLFIVACHAYVSMTWALPSLHPSTFDSCIIPGPAKVYINTKSILCMGERKHIGLL